MDSSEFKNDLQLARWHNRQSRDHANVSLIKTFEKWLENETRPEMIDSIFGVLRQEYLRFEDWENAKKLLMHELDKNPDSVLPLITLANQRLYYEEDFPQALIDIEVAIDKALRVDQFLLHALYVKARILKELKEYDLLSELLVDLTTRTDIPSKNGDCGREWDFTENLFGLVDSVIVDGFLKRHKLLKK